MMNICLMSMIFKQKLKVKQLLKFFLNDESNIHFVKQYVSTDLLALPGNLMFIKHLLLTNRFFHTNVICYWQRMFYEYLPLKKFNLNKNINQKKILQTKENIFLGI